MSLRPLALLCYTLLILTAISGCRGRRHRHVQDSRVYSSRSYTDYVVDSAFIGAQVAQDTSLRPLADDIVDFYQRRGYQAAWQDKEGLTISAYDFINTLRGYSDDFGDRNILAGLSDRELGAMLLSPSYDRHSLLDLRLTASFFRYAARAYGGEDVDPRDLEWYIPRMKKDYGRLLDSLVASPATYSEYEPVNDYYKALKKALVQYRNIKKHDGLPQIAAMLPLRRGDSAAAVPLVKRSLHATGDYSDRDMGMVYTDTLVAAVRRYQQRLGLRTTGSIDSATLSELNTPIDARIEQIMLNMERLRWMPDTVPARYILVNIPEYRLHTYDGHKLLWTMDVVVGNAATATNIFTGRLSVVDFCPYWNVPNSIIKKELLPNLKKNPSYLDKLNMEIVNGDQILRQLLDLLEEDAIGLHTEQVHELWVMYGALAAEVYPAAIAGILHIVVGRLARPGPLLRTGHACQHPLHRGYGGGEQRGHVAAEYMPAATGVVPRGRGQDGQRYITFAPAYRTAVKKMPVPIIARQRIHSLPVVLGLLGIAREA
jgi:murein L,D-transpeptidase YcbB/YkuD